MARRVDGVLVGCPMCCLLPQRCQEPACERVCGREYAHSPVLARSGGVGDAPRRFFGVRKSALASCKTLAITLFLRLPLRLMQLSASADAHSRPLDAIRSAPPKTERLLA